MLVVCVANENILRLRIDTRLFSGNSKYSSSSDDPPLKAMPTTVLPSCGFLSGCCSNVAATWDSLNPVGTASAVRSSKRKTKSVVKNVKCMLLVLVEPLVVRE